MKKRYKVKIEIGSASPMMLWFKNIRLLYFLWSEMPDARQVWR
jgi:hypothetical protein